MILTTLTKACYRCRFDVTAARRYPGDVAPDRPRARVGRAVCPPRRFSGDRRRRRLGKAMLTRPGSAIVFFTEVAHQEDRYAVVMVTGRPAAARTSP